MQITAEKRELFPIHIDGPPDPSPFETPDHLVGTSGLD